VVLDDNCAPGHADRLSEEYPGVGGVMEHVVERHHVETVLLIRKPAAVEPFHRNERLVSDQDIYPLDANARQPLFDQRRKVPVPTTDIQHACLRRQELGNPLAEDTGSSPADATLMDPFGEIHFRFSPRIPRKKLDRTI
jgi:hypothetical protein